MSTNAATLELFGMLWLKNTVKNIDVLSGFHGFPEFIAGAVVLALHFWKRNMFLSIAAGTLLYMFLVQQVFVA